VSVAGIQVAESEESEKKSISLLLGRRLNNSMIISRSHRQRSTRAPIPRMIPGQQVLKGGMTQNDPTQLKDLEIYFNNLLCIVFIVMVVYRLEIF
jgi:hypothetical protein